MKWEALWGPSFDVVALRWLPVWRSGRKAAEGVLQVAGVRSQREGNRGGLASTDAC